MSLKIRKYFKKNVKKNSCLSELAHNYPGGIPGGISRLSSL